MATLLFSSWIPSSSFAEKKPEEKLKEIQKKKKSAKVQVDKDKDKLESSKQKLEKLEEKIDQWDQKIAQSNKNLVANEKLLVKKEKQFDNFIRRMYIQGETRYLSKILSSENFNQFLMRYQLLNTLTKREMKLVTSYRKTQEDIEITKKNIEASKEKQLPLLANAKEEMSVIKTEFDKNSKKLTKLSKEEEATKKDVEELQRLARKASGEYSNNYGSGVLGFPTTRGTVYWNYGQNRGSHMHAGIDIPRPVGTPMYAADAGVVSLAKANPGGYGYYIMINHGNGLSTLYAHMYRNTVTVSLGQRVKKGQKIADVGNNGRSSGPHLHFEVHKNGSSVNPSNYIN